MLGALVLLGSSMKGDIVSTLVDRIESKDVFVIQLDAKCKYKGLTLQEKESEEMYLYRRAKEGLPGKFITGRISRADIQRLIILLSEHSNNVEKFSKTEEFKNFAQKKVGWVGTPKIMKDKVMISKIPKTSGKILQLIVKEIVVAKQERIAKDLCKKLLKGGYGEILLTVKVGNRYLKDIEGFPELFRMAVQGTDVSSFSSDLVSFTNRCIVCNNFALKQVLKEPLPFFTLDKPNFLPGLVEDNAHKAFPLCINCYGNLQKGVRFIEQNLIFSIPNTRGSKRIFFWIIPILHDPNLVKDFLKKPKSGLESFKEMLEFSGRAETARDIDVKMSKSREDDEDDTITSSFLTYSAIFHYYDRQKHMRLLGTVDGIYPSRLRELGEKKFEVDKIAVNCSYNASFHFGLITDFLEQDTEGWMRIMTYIMSRIFTSKQLDVHSISSILINAAREPFRKRLLQSFKLGQETWYEIMLKATITFEYFYRVRALLSMENLPESKLPNDEKARMAANFLNSHSGMLWNRNLRAICAIGIAVGIVVKAQLRYLKSDSFVSRLNRLEMDYQRLKGLFPKAFIKLKHYKAEEYTELLTYLGNEEIPNLDGTQHIDDETMNLIFSIGMCHGFTIFNTTAQGKTKGDNRL